MSDSLLRKTVPVLLRAQADEIVDELLVIVFVAVVAAVQISLVYFLAQVAPGRIGQQRNQTGPTATYERRSDR